jgi:hypothetical protein
MSAKLPDIVGRSICIAAQLLPDEPDATTVAESATSARTAVRCKAFFSMAA